MLLTALINTYYKFSLPGKKFINRITTYNCSVRNILAMLANITKNMKWAIKY